MNSLWALSLQMAEGVIRALYAEKDREPVASLPPAYGEQKDGYTVRNGVAVVCIGLPITRSDVVSLWTGSRLALGQDSIRKSLMAAYADTAVHTILLSINSPGGVVHGTKELADYIAASPKPMATYVNGLCASAAFWIASATGRIFAPKTASVGSIGVIQIHADYSKMYENFGVTFTPITAGTYKAVGSDSKPLSDEDRAYLQGHLSAIHAIFKDDVKRGLALTEDEKKWGEAQVFLADEALNLGLVSSIVQDMDEAIRILSKEIVMDKKTLAAQHPALLAEVQAEAVADLTAKAKQEQSAILAVVSACVGEECMASINATLEKCEKAGLTAEQMVALAPSLAVPVQTKAAEASTEEVLKQDILAGLQSASSDPLAATPGALQKSQGKSSLVADAESRAQTHKE